MIVFFSSCSGRWVSCCAGRQLAYRAKVLASVAVAFMVYFSVTMYQATQALMAAGMA
ncbi:MAG: hypothetical protein ACLSVD_18590 [Eggerthellaceae bacterium]